VETFHSLCEKLRLTKIGYAHDTLRLYQDGLGSASPEDELIVDPTSWPEQKQMLIDSVMAHLSHSRQTLAQDNIEILETTLDYMYSNDEVEVYSPKELPYQLMFREPLLLGSLAATKVFTRSILSRNWDKLLCVAESGEWLLAKDIVELVKRRPKRSLIVIVADGVYIKDIETTYTGQEVNVQVIRMPWWQHNQHMSLLIHQSHPVCGIYFERRLRALSVTPVGITAQDDLAIVLDTFLAYWTKAVHFRDNVENMFVHTKDVDTARTKLLK
jgi:hypothetical protein